MFPLLADIQVVDVDIINRKCKDEKLAEETERSFLRFLSLYASGADDELKEGKFCFEVF